MLILKTYLCTKYGSIASAMSSICMYMLISCGKKKSTDLSSKLNNLSPSNTILKQLYTS